MSQASSASISLRSRSSAAGRARESVSTDGCVPLASAPRTHMPPSERIQHGSGVCGNLCTYEAGEPRCMPRHQSVV